MQGAPGYFAVKIMNNKNEEILLTNKQWNRIDSKLCRILEFNPIASGEDGKITASNSTSPYATISFQCSNEENIFKGAITHKEDFKVLWAIFKERKIDNNEEVLFIWSNENYKNIIYSLLSNFMPKLWLCVFGEKNDCFNRINRNRNVWKVQSFRRKLF